MYKFYIDGMEIHARETYQTIYKPSKQTFNLADGREANVPTPQLPKEFLLTAHIDFRESSDVFERLNLIIDREEPVEFAISRETVDGEIINSEAYDVIVTSEIPFTEGASNGSFVVFNLSLIEYIPIKTKRIRQIAQTNKFTVQDKTTRPPSEEVQTAPTESSLVGQNEAGTDTGYEIIPVTYEHYNRTMVTNLFKQGYLQEDKTAAEINMEGIYVNHRYLVESIGEHNPESVKFFENVASPDLPILNLFQTNKPMPVWSGL